MTCGSTLLHCGCQITAVYWASLCVAVPLSGDRGCCWVDLPWLWGHWVSGLSDLVSCSCSACWHLSGSWDEPAYSPPHTAFLLLSCISFVYLEDGDIHQQLRGLAQQLICSHDPEATDKYWKALSYIERDFKPSTHSDKYNSTRETNKKNKTEK